MSPNVGTPAIGATAVFSQGGTVGGGGSPWTIGKGIGRGGSPRSPWTTVAVGMIGSVGLADLAAAAALPPPPLVAAEGNELPEAEGGSLDVESELLDDEFDLVGEAGGLDDEPKGKD